MQVSGIGPPEMVTGGRDGAVRVWDVRQPNRPVAAFEGATETSKVS
jgi:WD40 repeat protein